MNQPRPHPDESQWMAWIDGQLPFDQAALLVDHHLSCKHCEAVVAGLRHASDRLSRIPQPLPPEFVLQAKAAFLDALPGHLASLTDESAVRGCLGHHLAGCLATSPDQVRGAIHALLGTPNPSGVLRLSPRLVWFAAFLYSAITLVAWTLWLASGEWSYMSAAFGLPYKLFLMFAAAAAAVLCYGACRQFEPPHQLHSAWLLLFVASACRVLGTAVGTAPSVFLDGGFGALEPAGQFIAGPVSLAALGLGLLHAYKAYRSAGLRSALAPFDWFILAAGSLFTARHLVEIAGILLSGPAKPLIVMLNWLSEPALLFTLAVAVPLRRIAIAQGGGLVARCWGAMAAGALLTYLGNLLLFLSNYGYLMWPLNSVVWLVWIPAYAAFTLGPAYQLAANGSFAARPALAAEPR